MTWKAIDLRVQKNCWGDDVFNVIKKLKDVAAACEGVKKYAANRSIAAFAWKNGGKKVFFPVHTQRQKHSELHRSELCLPMSLHDLPQGSKLFDGFQKACDHLRWSMIVGFRL